MKNLLTISIFALIFMGGGCGSDDWTNEKCQESEDYGAGYVAKEDGSGCEKEPPTEAPAGGEVTPDVSGGDYSITLVGEVPASRIVTILLLNSDKEVKVRDTLTTSNDCVLVKKADIPNLKIIAGYEELGKGKTWCDSTYDSTSEDEDNIVKCPAKNVEFTIVPKITGTPTLTEEGNPVTYPYEYKDEKNTSPKCRLLSAK